MAALSSMQHRHGMIYLENDDSSSCEAELLSETEHNHHHHHSTVTVPVRPPGHSLRRSFSPALSDDSYDEVYSSDEDSYHSDCDEFAEYWDPYCKHS